VERVDRGGRPVAQHGRRARRAGLLLARAREGGSAEFVVDDARLDSAAAEVAAVTRARYPSLEIPFHSRWRHFEAGGVDRRDALDRRLGDADAAERARAQIDLALVSVLLDAGAGPAWRYLEPGTGLVLTRSEGLGVASFHAFVAGLFSSDPSQPLQVDAAGLRRWMRRRSRGPCRSGPAIRWWGSTAAWPCCAGSARPWLRLRRCTGPMVVPAACSTTPCGSARR
jgi:hypothetical protein